jgi:putative phosphoribosyl transferase
VSHPPDPVEIPQDGRLVVRGDLAVPTEPLGVVVFAHGSGSSRHSSRNRQVAAALHDLGLATLLMDLLTAEEEEVDRRTSEHRFDIDLLARRLLGSTGWLGEQPWAQQLRVGYFGASTGGGAALVAAARRLPQVAAVVSRGGRPDLAGDALAEVDVPTLLIVGERDPRVLQMNREAARRLRASWRLEVVAGASHLFEEPGALEEVARLAGGWFTEHLAGPAGRAGR